VALAPEWAETSGAYIKDGRQVRSNPRAENPTLIEQVETTTKQLLNLKV
jgi:hypothetical protein